MAKIEHGLLIDANVTQKICNKIEKGQLTQVHAIVVHQTGAPQASSTFNSYENGSAGAHFLVDKDGTIYQTARVDQKTYHVGKIRPRCHETKSCSVAELKAIEGIMFKKGESYSTRVKNLHAHESAKNYPDRYPTNDDSIGIELVGGTDAKGNYETVTKDQSTALQWLIGELQTGLQLTGKDLYRHPEVSYKQPSEASSATLK